MGDKKIEIVAYNMNEGMRFKNNFTSQTWSWEPLSSWCPKKRARQWSLN